MQTSVTNPISPTNAANIISGKTPFLLGLSQRLQARKRGHPARGGFLAFGFADNGFAGSALRKQLRFITKEFCFFGEPYFKG
jgi:hypothetical protein